MATAVGVKYRLDELRPEEPIAGDEDDAPPINNVESIKGGTIKTLNNKDQAPYNILLVGETGTGKSSLLEFIANVLIGKDIDFYDLGILDHSNEEGGSGGKSQTNSARIYELESKNGILVRILDTPGLADTRGFQQDDLHKKSIATQIQNNLSTVSAILILVNGTVPRITVGTDYALSALSALFPKTLVNNIAFLFSNTSNHLSFNVSSDTLPPALRGARQFLFDNPLALVKKCSQFKDGPRQKVPKTVVRDLVTQAEQKSLEMLVDLFDWLDGLEPQSTTEIVELYEKSQVIETNITNTLSQMNQAAAKMGEIKALVAKFQKKSADLEAFSNFEKIINVPVWMQQPSSTVNYICTTPYCYSTCGVKHSISSILLLLPMQFASCSKCTHPHLFHFHLRAEWVKMQEAQVSIDINMKRKWEAAKSEQEKTDALAETSQRALDDLGHIINDALDDLAELADEYAHLSLSGSFSAPLEKAICLLELQCKGLEEKGVGPEQLTKVRSTLDEMSRRLDLLRKAQEKVAVTKAQEKVWKGVRKVPIPAQEDVRRECTVQDSDFKVKEVPGGVLKVTGGIRGEQVKEVMERARERTRPDFLFQ